MKKDHYVPVRHLSGMVVATMAFIPTKATAEVPGCPSVPCHVELSSIEIDYPVYGDEKLSKAQTKITFKLHTQHDTWTLAASDDSGSDGGRSQHCYYRPSDGTLQLWYYMDQAPDSNRIMLDETLPITRSKKGRSFLSPVIELGSSGTFTMGDIPFAYESKPGHFWRTEGRTSVSPGFLNITYPENTSLASIEVLNLQGKVKKATPGARRKGKARFSLFPDSVGEDEKRVWLAVRLSEADEKLDIPLKKEITLGSLAGREKSADRMAGLGADTEPWLENLAQPASAASDVAEVRLKSLSLESHRQPHAYVFRATMRVNHLQGKLMSGLEMQPVLARDAEGNKMWGVYAGSDPSGNEDGSLDISLHFTQFPKGEWIQLDGCLRLLQADSSRTLAPQTIPLRQTGVLELDGLQLKYAANKPESRIWRSPTGDTPLELSFPKDGRIASVIVRDAEGRQMRSYFSGYSDSQIKEYYMADSSAGQHVQVEVQERLGVKHVVIPLTMKLGLAGEMKPEEKASSNK